MEKMTLTLTDRWQRPVQAEVLIEDQQVEFRYGGGVVGTASRGIVRDWLTCPGAPLIMAGLSLWEVASGVAIAIDTAMGEPEVPAYVLPDQVVRQLRAAV